MSVQRFVFAETMTVGLSPYPLTDVVPDSVERKRRDPVVIDSLFDRDRIGWGIQEPRSDFWCPQHVLKRRIANA